jgi:cytochrome c oxidase cbb3-type subunit 4
MSYDGIRHFADSWGLLFLVGTFLIFIGTALRPSARAHHDEARTIPFRDEDPGQ